MRIAFLASRQRFALMFQWAFNVLREQVMKMIRVTSSFLFVVTVFGLTACGADPVPDATVAEEVDVATNSPEVSFKPQRDDDEYDGTVTKPGSPYAISYRIVGTPVVGSPLIIDLRVASALGPRPLNLDYRINDASAMMFSDSQPDSVRMTPAANESAFKQQVTVVPQREGRFYLNVSASFETEDGTMSTVTAIPIQVGTGTRELQEHGELQQDENDETVRVLSNE